MRSGTQNVSGMVGFAAAAAACTSDAALSSEVERLRGMRDELYRFLCSHRSVHSSVPCAPGSTDYLPNVVNVTVDGLESETMVLRLDREGVQVSGGSACSSKSLAPNRILAELGIPRDLALGALRISMGRYTTEEDIARFKAAFRSLMEWAGLD